MRPVIPGLRNLSPVPPNPHYRASTVFADHPEITPLSSERNSGTAASRGRTYSGAYSRAAFSWAVFRHAIVTFGNFDQNAPGFSLCELLGHHPRVFPASPPVLGVVQPSGTPSARYIPSMFQHRGGTPRKSGSHPTRRWREMDSNHRSPVKDQLVETVLFDFPAEARKRTIGGRRSQPRDLGGDLRRDHNLRDDNDRLGWGRRQAQNGGSPDGGPMVRILLPPAGSGVRTLS